MHKSHQKLKVLVKNERKILVSILEHLKIINDEKVFTTMGYNSLLDYCVKELGYSESASYRRISALRLVRKIPEVVEKIESGAINLTTASTLNGLIDQKEQESHKKTSTRDKNQLLELVSNKSSSESEKIIRRKLELPVKKRMLSIEMSEESYQKWIQYKGKHVAKRMSDEMLFLYSLEKSAETKEVRVYHRATPLKSNNPRYIPAKIRRQVIRNAEDICQYPGCGSTYGLEIDHIVPVSRGGRGKIENLQLLCRHHNELKSDL